MQQIAAGSMLAGRFRLTRQLGQGGTASVWLARDTTLATDVALKIIEVDDEAAALGLAAGLGEDLRRLRRLVHPGIVRVFDAYVDGPCCCVSMESVVGGNLGELRGADFQTVVAAALEVVEALQYAHAQGVVHGDLKAGNVLRDERGRCRLADFRIAASVPAAAVSLSAASPQLLTGEAPGATDDIYALGALIYDLLAGHPPLHPGITPERIRSEVPARLGVDGRGQSLPPALIQLVAALLEKTPARRPAGMGAVRAVLEEILHYSAAEAAAGPGTINGLQRVARGTRPGAGDPRPPGPRERAGLPAWVVYVGFGVLAAGLAVVLFVLPKFVSERAPSAPRPSVSATPPGSIAPAPAAREDGKPAPDARRTADESLAELVRIDDAAKLAGAARWGGADWLEARRLADAGDAQYRAGDYAAATMSYHDAARRLKTLADGAPAQLATALRDGAAALERGDRAAAVASFERALQIHPDDPVAKRGLARSEKLDEVLRLMAEAGANESAGDLAAARRSYQAVLVVDGEWGPARSALARIESGLATGAFEREMAKGLAAMAAGRSAEARAAIESAVRIRPGDPGARSALEQLNSDERRGSIVALQADADRLAAAEQWAQAVARYEEVLRIDATLVAAKSGLEQARLRAALHEKLEQQLGRADRFNDDTIAGQARAVVTEASAVPSPGPVVTGQIARLNELLAVAARPVAVRFESDNQTSVVIFKVGPLGAFTSRTVELRPGLYVVVGSRDGYRDVRRNIRVDGAGNTLPVIVRCEEPI